jgi:glycosyltransferase involved in cell wall biosynthesis
MATVNQSPKTPRICVMTSVHPAFDVRIFHKECKSFARAGYRVTLIACHDHDEVVDGVEIKAIPESKARFVRMTRTIWTIYREAVRQDARLYHFHDPELIPIGLLLRLHHKTVVYDVHEDLRADLAFKHYIPRFIRTPLAWAVDLFEKSASRCFSAVVPATRGIEKRFLHLNSRAVVIKNFPKLEEFDHSHQDWTHRNQSVAFVGGISLDRGIKEMVQAMALLPDNLQATLELAGKFVPETLRQEVSKIKGWNRVQYRGMLGRAQVAGLLQNVRAGLVTLRPTPGFVESAPTKMFEYMNAGIPVIASDFPAFREIVAETKCGLLVNPLDPRAIAAAIEYVLTHPAEAEEMGRRGREVVQIHYNWANEERKLLALYGTLIDPPCVA